MSLSNSDIKNTLAGIYDKLSKANTKEVGYEQYKLLLQANVNSEKQINYILQQVAEYIASLSQKEKEVGLKLLPLIFPTLSSSSKCFTVISPILAVFQSNITEVNIQILPLIAYCFGEVVQMSMKNEMDLKEIDKYEQKIYELLQGFCIYNMKLNDKANKICGSLCLTKLVENCPFVLQPNYLEFIWETIISLIDKKTFNAKYELLNCLISMILGAESLFKPYANVTLFKVLDFLTDSDWLNRKLALNVVYTLILYCREEIAPLKEHIVDFLKRLKTDKVKEVRMVCSSILEIFNESGDKDANENYNSNSVAIKQRKKAQEKEKAREKLQEKESDKKKKEEQRQKGANYISVNTSLSGMPNPVNHTRKKSNEGKISKVLIRSSSNQFDLNNSKENCVDNDKRSLTPIKISKSKSKNNLNNKSYIDNANRGPAEEEAGGERKSRPGVNRKDNSFINEKMIIRRNPNYSIFKTGPNQDFFKQANNQPDIIILDNKKQRNVREKQEDEVNQAQSKGEDKGKDEEGKEDAINPEEKEDLNEDNQYSSLKRNEKHLDMNKDNNSKDYNEIGENNDQMSFRNNNPYIMNYQQQQSNKRAEMDEDTLQPNDNYQEDCDCQYDIDNNINTYPNIKAQNIQIHSDNNTNLPNSSKRKTNISLNLNPNPKSNTLSSPKEVNYKTKAEDNVSFLYQTDQPSNQNNFNNSNQQLMTDLILQMKHLSEKQVVLIDTLAEMQQTTTGQINSMTSKISQLESHLSSLTSQLASLRSNKPQSRQYNKLNDHQYSIKEYTSYNIKADKWEEIQMNLHQDNIEEAFHLALDNDSDLLRLINQITLTQLREVVPALIDDSLNHLIALLTKGVNIPLILSFIKNVLMGVKCDLKKGTKSKIRDCLLYILNNADNFASLKDDDLVDINLILSYFKSPSYP